MIRSINKFCICILILLFTVSNITNQNVFAANSILPSNISYDEIGHKIEEYVNEHEKNLAGMQVAIFNPNKVIYSGSFGYENIEAELKVNEETVMEWGSISKLLVWVSAMQLWEQGKLDLNADITTYLPNDFLHNINFDIPITMLNLMNHNAGFQEMLTDICSTDIKCVKNLKDALQDKQPAQIYKPGEVTAYSNWGAALAGYIVENISGKPFYQYVKENIFEPLGMEHISLAVDLSDNIYVQQHRSSLKCYDSLRNPLKNSFYYIPLYPAGMCTGTINDLALFAQSLIPYEEHKCILFENQQTLNEMLSPTNYYGDTDIKLNCHGLWEIEYGVSVLGHAGNTIGCSSILLFDPVSAVGTVVMTNQMGETVFNSKMIDLVFGSFENSIYSNYNTDVPSGFYRSSRTISQGPMSIYSIGLYKFGDEDLESFWIKYDVNGIQKVASIYSDMLHVDNFQVIIMLGLILILCLGFIYSLVALIKALIVYIIKKRRKKVHINLYNDSHDMNRIFYIAHISVILFVVNIVIIALRVSVFASSSQYIWQFGINIILSIIMSIYILVFIINYKKLECPKKKKLKYIISVFIMLIYIFAFFYWHLGEFWNI